MYTCEQLQYINDTQVNDTPQSELGSQEIATVQQNLAPEEKASEVPKFKDTPSRSGNLLTTAATAPIPKPAAVEAEAASTRALVMMATETKPADVAEVVQARSQPCRSRTLTNTLAATNRDPT